MRTWILEGPAFEEFYTPATIAAFLVLWLTLIMTLSFSEWQHSEH